MILPFSYTRQHKASFCSLSPLPPSVEKNTPFFPRLLLFARFMFGSKFPTKTHNNPGALIEKNEKHKQREISPLALERTETFFFFFFLHFFPLLLLPEFLPPQKKERKKERKKEKKEKDFFSFVSQSIADPLHPPFFVCLSLSFNSRKKKKEKRKKKSKKGTTKEKEDKRKKRKKRKENQPRRLKHKSKEKKSNNFLLQHKKVGEG
jgi:hypothetical protein